MPSLAITGERAEQKITTCITGASHDKGAKEEELEPLRRLQLLQSGVGTVISGYPQRDTFVTQPDPSPLATALGVGSTLAGIYGAVKPRAFQFLE